MITISFAITAHNEANELNRLLNQLTSTITNGDEIVIQLDSTATATVKFIVDKYPNVKCHTFSLDKDFATFKNNLKNVCTKDYIFFIDADEYLSEQLVSDLRELLEINKHVDLFSVPRINTVERLTEEHIKKWGWQVNQNRWINYPDLQDRIIKNKKEIYWINKVHEKITGAMVRTILPDGYDLIHPKTIDNQEKQNAYYATI